MSTTEIKTESLIDRFSHRVSNFLFFCAGANTKLLAQCTHTDRVKSQGIGGVVLATAVLAFFSGSYAFYTIFSPKQGMAMEAIQQAAASRLRPILMTSLATALGALPIALALGAGAKSRMGMGIVIIGGLLLSMVLTLFVIPAMYSYLVKDKKIEDETI